MRYCHDLVPAVEKGTYSQMIRRCNRDVGIPLRFPAEQGGSASDNRAVREARIKGIADSLIDVL